MLGNSPRCTVVLASNENGVLPLSVTLFSLVDSAHDTTVYDIVVCSEGLSQESRDSIEAIVKRVSGRHHVRFIDMEGVYREYGELGKSCGDWPLSTWARVFVAEMLRDTDRVLYIDIDMLVCDDCSALFSLDMKGAVAGVVYESISAKDHNHNKVLGIPELYQGYFNAGTLLIDLNEFRRSRWGEKILGFAREHADALSYPDQDSMNAVMYEHLFRLHPRWNWNDIATRRLLNHSSNTNTLIRAATFREVVEASCYPGIIHYCGQYKPWKYNFHITRARYEAVLRKSGVAGYDLKEGWSFKIFRKRLAYALTDKLVWMKVRRMMKRFKLTGPPPAETWGLSREFASKGWNAAAHRGRVPKGVC